MANRIEFSTRACLLMVAGLVLAASSHGQSAWALPEGASFLQVSAGRIGPYEKLFTESGPDFRTGREITETSIELYGEYGLSESWTLVGTVPFRSVDAGSVVTNATIQPVTIESGTLDALGNVVLGVRKQLSTGDFAWATQFDLELPTGSTRKASGLAAGLDAFTLLPTLSVGRGFGRGYAQAYAGFGLRTDDYSNDWRAGAELGFRLTEDLTISGTLDVVESLEDGSVNVDARQLETGLFVDEQEYVSLGLKGTYQVTESFGFSGSLRGAASGQNVPKSGFMSFGVYFRN